MALFSVMQMALTGLTAAETTLGVVANNLANSRTEGFKASRVRFATQGAGTLSLGQAPSGSSGGVNPLQIGMGVQVAEIGADFSQGTIVPSADPLDLALNGQGFFIVETAAGERLFSRQGKFRLNAQQQLVTANGERVLGFAVDDAFQLRTGELTPLTIPIGHTVAGAGGQAVTLTGFRIATNGRIRGQFSDGVTRDLGQIRLARFANPRGLISRGNSLYAAGINSGLPIEQSPAEAGAAEIIPGATEQSNTNVGAELVTGLLAENSFRANLLVMAVASDLLHELTWLQRP